MKIKELSEGKKYRCTCPFREGEYIYVGERLIGHCFEACDGNRNMAMSEAMVAKYIKELT